ncbi:helicase-related protein [Mycoplasma sp. SG1]|uniref:helicase-related protein n=1 Tax=Mycoplasma sp. SG1 TaxID=2810348 RepID=UPI002024C376|nr:helicase-related protein [Mycoplasma sp. SG1]
MYNTDISRKSTLVEYGFRLPSCLDNRPLNYQEFESKIRNAIYLSATPGDFELEKANNEIVEQIIRPTGLVDPLIEVRPRLNQLDNLLSEIKETVKRKQRIFVVTLTIRSAEEVSDFLVKKKIKSVYLHNKIKTLERTDILLKLRKGIYDCVVGINLLREGLDIPEISRILILDADKEGFLRDKRSLIQIIGRAARNVDGKVIMYADKYTKSMSAAIYETNRRRNIQIEYNQKNNIIPQTIIKPIDESFLSISEQFYGKKTAKSVALKKLNKTDTLKAIRSIRSEMMKAAKKLDFEKAAKLRDIIFELELNIK